MLLGQSIVDIGIGICCFIARSDALICEPLIGREPLVVLDCCLEEVDNFFVFAVLWSIAWDVESAVASSVFREFMAPKAGTLLERLDLHMFWKKNCVPRVILKPGDPVCVHVSKLS